MQHLKKPDTLELELVIGGQWELNPGGLQEQQALVIFQPSLHPSDENSMVVVAENERTL